MKILKSFLLWMAGALAYNIASMWLFKIPFAIIAIIGFLVFIGAVVDAIFHD